MIRLGLAAVVVAVLMASGVAHSGEPPSEPVLRIETGMHTAPIKRIGIAAAFLAIRIATTNRVSHELLFGAPPGGSLSR